MGSSYLPNSHRFLVLLLALPQVIFMPAIPLYLIVITLFLVVIPSGITIVIRISLYLHLINLTNEVQRLIKTRSVGGESKIIQTLEDRFDQASKQLEQVNTGALIDQIYSQETIKGFRFTCEQIDYLCRILPNLLLAFGLLGTFLGITINLSTLSQTINQANASDVSNLVTELKKPLEGMSIAFTTSLTGLFFSALVTVFNFIFNSGLAKYRLISSLEDYLDNVYFPEVQGDTRLDKIVNKMVSQQDEFLTNFGKTVREAVEQSMGNVAKQIADGNKETTDLARQVYEKFTVSAGTISSAANEFRSSMSELNITSQIFKQSAETFNKSEFPLKLSLAVVDLSNTQQKFSESATSLAATTELIINALIEIENSSQSLINLGEEIKSMNQTSIQVLDLHQNNQNLLSEIIPQLHAGANSYEKAVNKLDDLDQRVGDKFNNFDQLITAMSQLLENVKTYTKELISTVSTETENSSQSLISLAEEIKAMNQTSIQVLDLHKNNQNLLSEIIPQLQQGANSYEKAVSKLDDLDQRVRDKVNSFDKLITTIEQLLENVKTYTNNVNTAISIASNQTDANSQKLMKLLENNNYQLIAEYQNVSNTLIQGIDRQTNINKKGFEANIKGLELLIKNLEEYQQKLSGTNTDT
jgi:tetrahydromethanopterin S-methyltransferase subunit G